MDADPDFAQALLKTLDRLGVPPGQIDRASPSDALRRLAERAKPPSFLLLDLHVPEADALALLEAARRGALPAFVLARSADPQDIAPALEWGASSYILKSLSPDALQSALEGVLALWACRENRGPSL